MIKKTVIAGTFYPKEKLSLTKMLDNFFSNTVKNTADFNPKKLFAIIAPHAGYYFSGQTAANIYHVVKQYDFKNAVIIAPSHYNASNDFFIGKYDEYETPLGEIKTNQQMINKLQSKKGFFFDQSVDLREHSLEIHLPFLKYIKPHIQILPIIFVRQNFINAKILSEYLSDFINEDTLFIISTDLSHFYKSTVAEKMDKKLIGHIKNFNIEKLEDDFSNKKIEACGFGGILTLLHLIKNLDSVEIGNIQYTHSGHASNDFKQVVGYFSCGFYK
ncbi:MAG: AmmeMemoRadiSam system protein B [Candidatus Cloacimonetes bacterium]|nr:AmmeMemoRadiSam system protein B [Candidatus Cloacimonadota bacterium]